MARRSPTKTGKKDPKCGKRGPASAASPRRWPYLAAVAALLVLHYALAVTSSRHKSNTYDELAHLTRGYSYFQTGDYRLGPPHPPLAHYWAALPGRGERIKPFTAYNNAWHTSDIWDVGRYFFYYKNIGNAAIIDALLFRGRAMIAIFSVACGLVVYFWSRRLFGPTGALISLALYAFSPTMLAHARLVTTDCAVTLFFMTSLAAIHWVLRRVSLASVLVSAASLTCLFLSKMSAVLIIPVGVILLVIRLIDGRPLTLAVGRKSRTITSRPAMLGSWLAVMCVWVLIVWSGIWAAYGFRYRAFVDYQPDRDHFYTNMPPQAGQDVWDVTLRSLDKPIAGIGPKFTDVIDWLREHRVFPEAYIYCAAYGKQTARGRNAFLNGNVNIFGFRSYFPYTFLIKTPLPLLALLAVAVAVPLAGRRNAATAPPTDETAAVPTGRWDFALKTSPLWVFLIVYWAASISSRLNIGHRHIMPTYPVLFIFCGATAAFLESRTKLLRLLVPLLVGLFAVGSLAAFPNYLAYFNYVIGGPAHAYRHLVDSSLDWGQDLPGLKSYLDDRRQAGFDGNVYVAYFGSGGTLAIDHFGINAITLPINLPKASKPGDSPDIEARRQYQPGIYAISATILQQVYLAPDDTKYRKAKYRWDEELESDYQRLRKHYSAFLDQPDAAPLTGEFATAEFRREFYKFDKYRLARLCAYLRRREPDDFVGYSILIYNVTENDLTEALTGPAPYDANKTTNPST